MNVRSLATDLGKLAMVGLCAWTSLSSAARAQETNASSKLQLINGSSQTLSVFWLADDGEMRKSTTLDANARTSIATTIGHIHVLKDESDGEIARFQSTLPVQAFHFEKTGQVRLADLAAELPQNTVLSVPENANVAAFYSKLLIANGYPILASAAVNDYALLEAGFLVNKLLDSRPQIRDAMVESGSRLYIMSEDEFTTDLPEFRWLAKRSPVSSVSGREYWDARARGLGGSDTDPYCSVGEENLLAYPGDPYSSENILIHEFAHNIHLRGLLNVDPTFDRRLKQVYRKAMSDGLWKGKYASVNHHEYFAEGVQSWFDDNRENDHDHNHVNTRQELVDYDPRLAEICREVFKDIELTYTKPTERLTGHMSGYNPQLAPSFKWPRRLEEAKRAIRKQVEERTQ